MKIINKDLNHLYSGKVIQEILEYENPLYEKLYIMTFPTGIVMVSYLPNMVVSYGINSERKVHSSATFIHSFKNKNEKVISGEIDYRDTQVECE